MEQNELIKIFNQATKDELTAFPGIGKVLAEKIIAGRPYSNTESLRSIKGVGENQIARILLVPAPGTSNIDPAKPASVPQKNNPQPESAPNEIKTAFADEFTEMKETIEEKSHDLRENIDAGLSQLGKKTKIVRENLSESLSDLGETLSEKSQAARETMSELPEKFEQTARTRGMFWTMLISSTVTGVITIILLLSILLVVNGSLKYATQAQYNTLAHETTLLNEQTSNLQQDLTNIRSRLVTLEGFGERTVALEKAQAQIAADVESASQQVTAMQDTINALNDQINVQEQRTQRFETFLKELQNLLGGLFTSQGEIQ